MISYPADTLMGDWQGKLVMVDGSEQQLIAQVISLADDNYQANLLGRFDSRDSVLYRLKGHKTGSEIFFAGNTGGTECRGTIKGYTFSGNLSGLRTGKFTMFKIERNSPTLGKLPPPQALVLFSGQNLEQWRQVHDPVGYINLARYIGGNDCAAYLKTSVWSGSEQRVMMLLGSDDGVKVWINDSLVWLNRSDRGANPADDTVQVSLKQGWNIILCKIANGDGGWGVYLKLVDQQDASLSDMYEKIPGSEDSKSRESLVKNDYYLTVWQISGLFREKKLHGNQLLDVIFPPEQNYMDWKNLNLAVANDSAEWRIIDDVMEVLPGSGSIITRQRFTDFELHLEFRLPFMPDQRGQKRGNSGVYLQGRYEVQILDSYGLEGADNECGGIYKVAYPQINMCAPPLQWQTYDITFRAARFDTAGNKMESTQITVLHNGIPIHENLRIPGPTGGAIEPQENKAGGLMLQDHSDLVQFRNIWIVE